MLEEWKPIKGFENYAVSNFGQIKNILTGYLLHPQTDKKGYCEVWLRANGKRKKFSVHRLVAIAFIPNEQNKPQVNHKDGNKANNNVSNLEFVTNRENIVHSFQVLGRKHSGGKKAGTHKLLKGGWDNEKGERKAQSKNQFEVISCSAENDASRIC